MKLEAEPPCSMNEAVIFAVAVEVMALDPVDSLVALLVWEEEDSSPESLDVDSEEEEVLVDIELSHCCAVANASKVPTMLVGSPRELVPVVSKL